MNPNDIQDDGRRQVLKGAGVLAAGAATMPGWVLPALAQGERLVPFTDVPEAFQVRPKRPGATHYQGYETDHLSYHFQRRFLRSSALRTTRNR